MAKEKGNEKIDLQNEDLGLIDNYKDEVHQWAMSHGANNEGGRMSKHFFKPGHSPSEDSHGLNWTYPLEMEKLGYFTFQSEDEILFSNEKGDSPRHLAVARVHPIEEYQGELDLKFKSILINKNDEYQDDVLRLVIKITNSDEEQVLRQDIKPEKLESGEIILDFDDKLELIEKTSGTVSFTLYINQESICQISTKISKIEINGMDILANPLPPFDLVNGAFVDYSWVKGKEITIISGCELSYVSKFLKRSGMKVNHTYENHGAMDPYTELMNPTPSVDLTDSDYILLSQVQIIRSLITFWERNRGETTPDKQKKQIESTINALDWSINKIREKSNSPIWITTHIWTDAPMFGIHEYRGCGDGLSPNEINLYYKLLLYELCKKHDSTYVLDIDIAFDSKGKWPKGGAPNIRPYESLGGHPQESGARVIAGNLYHQMCTISKHIPKIKCVILDCDNTLWEGVIREDGLEGIKVHKNRLSKLRYLSRRGLILALCSKNDPEDEALIMQALEENDSEMANAIVTTRINWNPKSANILSIVDELNIGRDSIAFFDDNPFERAEVNSVAPDIRVFEEKDIEKSPNWPIFHPYGDIISDTGNRFQLYKDESKRKVQEESFKSDDFESFLHSCELRLEIRSAQLEDLPRISELIQRTNQMNATLKRFDLPEIRKKFNGKEDEIFITKLGDSFGDYGIIGTAICSTGKGDVLTIDELALSCRAMGRNVEHALIEELIGYCNDSNISKIQIYVQKTSRNHQIISILEECGFIDTGGNDSINIYTLDVGDRNGRNFPSWFTITEVGSTDSD